jgi:hypothetical protein
VNDESDSSDENIKVRVNNQKQRQQAFRVGSASNASTRIRVNGNSASILKVNNNKMNNNSVIFLGDCEMPITKSGSERKSVGSESSGIKSVENKYVQKIKINGNNGELKHQFAASSQQAR